MRRGNRLAIRSTTAIALGVAAAVCAAPGDRIARYTLPGPTPCTATAYGLAFDGTYVHYSEQRGQGSPVIHRFEAASLAYAGSVSLNRAGTPVAPDEYALGLAWDPNRGALWVESRDALFLVAPEDGDILFEFARGWFFRSSAAAYDAFRDHVWVPDNDLDSMRWYTPNGLIGPTIATYYLDGLTFDGLHLWRVIPTALPPPAPSTAGQIFPCTTNGVIDYGRLFVTPHIGFADLAYDCVTFPIRVVWAASYEMDASFHCLIDAYEVEAPAAPCLSLLPNDRLLRTDARGLAPADRAPALPVGPRNAIRAWRVVPPLDFEDDERAPIDEPVLQFYRYLGTGDADKGNVLRLERAPVTGNVIATEAP